MLYAIQDILGMRLVVYIDAIPFQGTHKNSTSSNDIETGHK